MSSCICYFRTEQRNIMQFVLTRERGMTIWHDSDYHFSIRLVESVGIRLYTYRFYKYERFFRT